MPNTQSHLTMQHGVTIIPCMSGSVHFKADRRQWAITWYWKRRKYIVSRYKGRLMHQTHPSKRRDQGYIDANRLLAQMQGDVENGVFRIEKYLSIGYTDVIPYYEQWLERRKKRLKPATYKGYKSYLNNWFRPFFIENPIQLHEVQFDTIENLFDFITLQPKGKFNVMNAFRAFLGYAYKSRRIAAVPPFPEKKDYGMVKKKIVWLTEERQFSVLEQIPDEHKPIFYFLKYTARRPSEACALYKIDYDRFSQSFYIRRSISDRQLVHSTKTDAEHAIPCHSDIIEMIEEQVDKDNDSPFLFVNPKARRQGKRYSDDTLNRIWKEACKKAGEDIPLYSGTKHSTLSQYHNEKGLGEDAIQTISDHANRASVRQYTDVTLATKRRLFETPTLVSRKQERKVSSK